MKKLLRICSSLLLLTFFAYLLFVKRRKNDSLIVLKNEYYEEKENILLNLNNFNYLLKNTVCQKNTSFVQVITSFAGDVEARSAIRRAYPSSLLEKIGIVRVFLLADLKPLIHKTDVTQSAIVNENERFHDLIQGNFIESYKNLTYKHVMGLKWAVTYCPHVDAIIKMDDDILVDLYRLTDLIKKKDFHLMGYVLTHMRPIRMKANKWYVTKDEYAGNSYPPFLSGWLYVVKLHAARQLLSEAQNSKFFWIDDLFVTGILAHEARIPRTDISSLFSLHPEVVECCLRKGLSCDFIVAPTGGENELQTRFQQHTQTCYRNSSCPSLSSNKKIEDICVAKRKLPHLKKGIAQLTAVKL